MSKIQQDKLFNPPQYEISKPSAKLVRRARIANFLGSKQLSGETPLLGGYVERTIMRFNAAADAADTHTQSSLNRAKAFISAVPLMPYVVPMNIARDIAGVSFGEQFAREYPESEAVVPSYPRGVELLDKQVPAAVQSVVGYDG